MSKGEDKVASLLRQAKIPFTQEKTFCDLRKGRYRYDFFIPELSGRPAIIELNGEQHYKFISAFYKTTREWQAALERDRRKISYALANNIDIYLVPYFDLPSIQTAADLFKQSYKAKNRWHNDDVRLALNKCTKP